MMVQSAMNKKNKKYGATSGLGEAGATSDPQILVNRIRKLYTQFQVKIRKNVEEIPSSVDTIFGNYIVLVTTTTTERCRS